MVEVFGILLVVGVGILCTSRLSLQIWAIRERDREREKLIAEKNSNK
tara:strand:- start:40 stop:180 length:141 start_codon:yes stop_codon:yes gene_type:complete